MTEHSHENERRRRLAEPSRAARPDYDRNQSRTAGGYRRSFLTDYQNSSRDSFPLDQGADRGVGFQRYPDDSDAYETRSDELGGGEGRWRDERARSDEPRRRPSPDYRDERGSGERRYEQAADRHGSQPFGLDAPDDVWRRGYLDYPADRSAIDPAGSATASGSSRNGRSGSAGSEPDFTGRGPKGYRRSDERIREDVCDRLSEHPSLDASEIEVSVTEGHVELTGTVEHRRAKRLAEDAIDHVRGLVDVSNKLRIQGTAGRDDAAQGSAMSRMPPGELNQDHTTTHHDQGPTL